jgi:hypothetical protein
MQDTINNACKKAKAQGLPEKRAPVGFMLKGGILVGGYGQTLQDTRYRHLILG